MIIDRAYLITEEEGDYLKDCEPYERNEFQLNNLYVDFVLIASKVKQECIIKTSGGDNWGVLTALYRDTETGHYYLRYYEWDTSN